MATSGDDTYNPWNPKNRKIQMKQIVGILRAYGITDTPRNPSLFQTACVHKSYSKRDPDKDGLLKPVPRPEGVLDLQDEDNEELEFIGDSLLGAVVGTYLFERYPKRGEGFYTRLRTKIVNNKSLGLIVQAMGLNHWMVISRHVEERCNGRKNLKILGGLMESWIGAVYREYESRGLDGFGYTRAFITRILETHLDFAKVIREDYNYKDQILKAFQSKFGAPAKYKIVSIKGPPHDRTFVMGVISPTDGSIIATGTARAKQVAEQIASKNALEKLK